MVIAKPRQFPFEIRAEEALLRRLPERHPKYPDIYHQLINRKAKYNRVKHADNYLDFLPQDNLFIFQGHTIRNNGSILRLDTLILSPSAALIIEYNHVSGTLYVDPAFNQLIQRKNGVEKGLPDPFANVHIQQRLLLEWARAQHLPELPVDVLIVFCHPEAKLKTPPANSVDQYKICHANQLVYKINRLLETYGQETDGRKMKKWKKQLEKPGPAPLQPETLSIGCKKEDLYHGVQCAVCRHFNMVYQEKKWQCQNCGYESETAHHQAIEDYFLLFGGRATAQMLCDFLFVNDPETVENMLASMHLPYQNTAAGREYCWYKENQI